LELDTSTAGDKSVNATLPASAPTDPAPYAYPGDPGSRFKMENADGKGDPVAKVVIQDSKVLRVSSQPPANQQGQQGQQQAQQQNASNQQGQANATPTDMIVLEMTDQQAEVMKFIQDNGGSFTFALRAKDDHTVANTSGITYDLLVTSFQLPAPKSVRLPGDKQP
jgi:Flp pilus assembly protein CpaB